MRIELRQTRKSFGPVKANDGIDLVFEGGKIYGLLGENGAGKSTLMKILSGYQSPDSGLVTGRAEIWLCRGWDHLAGRSFREPFETGRGQCAAGLVI